MSLPKRNVAALFAPLHAELMALLRGLTADDWQRQTVALRWRVRDVVAHLLDTQLRKLAAHRDGHLAPAGGAASVLDIINTLNAFGSGRLVFLNEGATPTEFLDVVPDNYLSPIDALDVINYVNAQSSHPNAVAPASTDVHATSIDEALMSLISDQAPSGKRI